MRSCFLGLFIEHLSVRRARPSFERPVWRDHQKEALPKWYFSLTCIAVKKRVNSQIQLSDRSQRDTVTSSSTLTTEQCTHSIIITRVVLWALLVNCSAAQRFKSSSAVGMKKIVCAYLFFQRSFQDSVLILQTHNEQTDTVKEKAPGRRSSPGTGQLGRFTMDSFILNPE